MALIKLLLACVILTLARAEEHSSLDHPQQQQRNPRTLGSIAAFFRGNSDKQQPQPVAPLVYHVKYYENRAHQPVSAKPDGEPQPTKLEVKAGGEHPIQVADTVISPQAAAVLPRVYVYSHNPEVSENDQRAMDSVVVSPVKDPGPVQHPQQHMPVSVSPVQSFPVPSYVGYYYNPVVGGQQQRPVQIPVKDPQQQQPFQQMSMPCSVVDYVHVEPAGKKPIVEKPGVPLPQQPVVPQIVGVYTGGPSRVVPQAMKQQVATFPYQYNPYIYGHGHHGGYGMYNNPYYYPYTVPYAYAVGYYDEQQGRYVYVSPYVPSPVKHHVVAPPQTHHYHEEHFVKPVKQQDALAFQQQQKPAVEIIKKAPASAVQQAQASE